MAFLLTCQNQFVMCSKTGARYLIHTLSSFSRKRYLFQFSSKLTKMASLPKREEIICLFDVDGTLTMPRNVSYSPI